MFMVLRNTLLFHQPYTTLTLLQAITSNLLHYSPITSPQFLRHHPQTPIAVFTLSFHVPSNVYFTPDDVPSALESLKHTNSFGPGGIYLSELLVFGLTCTLFPKGVQYKFLNLLRYKLNMHISKYLIPFYQNNYSSASSFPKTLSL